MRLQGAIANSPCVSHKGWGYLMLFIITFIKCLANVMTIRLIPVVKINLTNNHDDNE